MFFIYAAQASMGKVESMEVRYYHQSKGISFMQTRFIQKYQTNSLFMVLSVGARKSVTNN